MVGCASNGTTDSASGRGGPLMPGCFANCNAPSSEIMAQLVNREPLPDGPSGYRNRTNLRVLYSLATGVGIALVLIGSPTMPVAPFFVIFRDSPAKLHESAHCPRVSIELMVILVGLRGLRDLRRCRLPAITLLACIAMLALCDSLVGDCRSGEAALFARFPPLRSAGSDAADPVLCQISILR